MKGLWWKILSVVILLYVIIFGLTVPLKPGIANVDPTRALAGERASFIITGYNTRFPETGIRSWLKLDDDYTLIISDIERLNESQLELTLEIPKEFPLSGEVHPMTLIIDDEVNGGFVLPRAIFVRQCSFNKTADPRWQPSREIDIHELSGFRFPYRSILYETIRNVYYHVPMWFGMIILFFGSAWCSIRYVRNGNPEDDMRSLALNSTATIFGILGLITGMIWAQYTWGVFWSWDVKQNTAAIAVLIYLAYFVLRGSISDPDRRARVSAVYNIFGCAMLIPLLFVIPRLTVSLHPGSGGNPALGEEDLDNMMRLVFYPAVIGWTLLGVWISELRFRLLRLQWERFFGK